jgi:hypothetical protein
MEHIKFKEIILIVTISRNTQAEDSVTRWLLTQDTVFYRHEIEYNLPQQDKCLSFGGNYLEK